MEKGLQYDGPLLIDKPMTAQSLSVSPRTVDNLVGRGVLKPVKIFRRTMFRYSDVVALARRGTR